MQRLCHANTGWVQSVKLSMTTVTISSHNYLHDVILKGYRVCNMLTLTKLLYVYHIWICVSWRRLLKVPWTARRSNPSIVKEISPGCSLEGLMLNLKLQYFGHLMRRVDSLIMGGIGGRRRRGRQRMRWLDDITNSMGMSLSQLREFADGQGGLACCDSWGRSQTRLSDWTELKAL